MVISPITRCASSYLGLNGSRRKPYLLKICSLNLESRSIACHSFSNLCLREFLSYSWRIWFFHLCWIRLFFCFLVGSFPFPSPLPLMSHSSGFWCSGSWCLALLVCCIYCHFLISHFAQLHSLWIWMVGLPVLGRKSFFSALSLELVSISQYVPCGAFSAWLFFFQQYQGCWKGSLLIPLPLESLHLRWLFLVFSFEGITW